MPKSSAKIDPLSDEVDVQTFNLVGAARHVAVTPSAVRYWIISGSLPATLVNGHWVIRRDELEKANEAAQKKARAGLRGKRGTYVPVAADS